VFRAPVTSPLPLARGDTGVVEVGTGLLPPLPELNSMAGDKVLAIAGLPPVPPLLPKLKAAATKGLAAVVGGQALLLPEVKSVTGDEVATRWRSPMPRLPELKPVPGDWLLGAKPEVNRDRASEMLGL
jgi:hypothetical protein